jgi:hypothetical protein
MSKYSGAEINAQWQTMKDAELALQWAYSAYRKSFSDADCLLLGEAYDLHMQASARYLEMLK